MRHKNGIVSAFVEAGWIAAGAAVLLVPALVSGRPFIFYDSWVFYMWGKDVLAAISHPWPAVGQFPAGRNLWASEAVSALPAIVDVTQFRLTLSAIGSRSVFYAVPVYFLGSLWATAAAQAALVSGVLDLLVRAVGWRHRMAFMGLVVFLTLTTTLPFFAAFIMPDIFTGLSIIAAGLLLFFFDRLPVFPRWILAALIAYAMGAHNSNALLMAAALPIGIAVVGLRTSIRDGFRRSLPVAAAVFAGIAALVLASIGLRMVFGRPVQNPPFALGRIIADGPGLAYLQESCETVKYVSCELVDPNRKVNLYTEGFMWPQIGEFKFSPEFDPDRRERFYAEQWQVVMGAIEHHALGQAKASLTNAFWQLVMFKLRPEMNDALVETLRMPLRRAGITASLTPNVEVCQEGDGHACNRAIREWMWRFLQLWQHAVVGLSGLFLIVSIAPALMSRARRMTLATEQLFAIFCCCLVGVNGIICGVLSGPYNRYQARVVWLVPLAALVVAGRAWVERVDLDLAPRCEAPPRINR